MSINNGLKALVRVEGSEIKDLINEKTATVVNSPAQVSNSGLDGLHFENVEDPSGESIPVAERQYAEIPFFPNVDETALFNNTEMTFAAWVVPKGSNNGDSPANRRQYFVNFTGSSGTDPVFAIGSEGDGANGRVRLSLGSGIGAGETSPSLTDGLDNPVLMLVEFHQDGANDPSLYVYSSATAEYPDEFAVSSDPDLATDVGFSMFNIGHHPHQDNRYANAEFYWSAVWDRHLTTEEKNDLTAEPFPFELGGDPTPGIRSKEIKEPNEPDTTVPDATGVTARIWFATSISGAPDETVTDAEIVDGRLVVDLSEHASEPAVDDPVSYQARWTEDTEDRFIEVQDAQIEDINGAAE